MIMNYDWLETNALFGFASIGFRAHECFVGNEGNNQNIQNSRPKAYVYLMRKGLVERKQDFTQ